MDMRVKKNIKHCMYVRDLYITLHAIIHHHVLKNSPQSAVQL